MKALTDLNNVEKAKLLHSLFPYEMAALLQFISSMNKVLHEEEELQRKTWPEGHLLTFDFWLSLAEQAEKGIEKYGRKLEKSSSLFAGQLFDGYTALFSVHCLIQYTTIRRDGNEKFSLAINLLFT